MTRSMIARHWTKTSVLAALVSAPLCTFHASVSAEVTPELLIGSWKGEEVDGDLRTYGEITIGKDGHFVGSMELQKRAADGGYKKVDCMTFQGDWGLDEEIISYRNLAYSNGTQIDLMQDRILEVSADSIRYEDMIDGKKFVRHRILSSSHSCD